MNKQPIHLQGLSFFHDCICKLEEISETALPMREPTPLTMGETRSETIHAACSWNPTSVILEEGKSYDFAVDPAEQWFDTKNFPCGADGYTSDGPLRYAQWMRRVPGENWFKLIGFVEKKGQHLTLGRSLPAFSPAQTGQLWCFANDVLLMYWNNTGKIELKVTCRSIRE